MTHQTDTHTVLIIDDSPSNLSVVVNLMEDRGYRVAIAQDGEEGLQRAGLVQPGLILLDVMLPDTDGFEICRRLKAQEKTRNIPVIFMTSLASIEHKINGFDAGGVDYVTKPLQIDEVMARVDTQLKLHAAQRKLEEYNEELERRVAERTAELSESNRQLREEVAERKRLEKKARAREQEFRSLAENLPDNIARWDRAGRYLYVNPVHELTLQMSAAEVLGKRASEIFPDERLDELIAKIVETGSPQLVNAPLPQDDGSLRIHEISFVPERNAQGEIVGVLGIGRDMTERKRLEQAILDREAELRSVADSSPYSIIRYDLDCRMTYANAPLLGYFGIPLSALIGKRPCEVWPDGRYAEIDRGITQVLETGTDVIVEFPETFTGGEVFHHQIWIVPERSALGELVGIIAFGLDITARRHAEREAHLLNRALDNSFDATYLLDTDLHFRYVNEAAIRALGYSREELLSLSLLDIDPNVTREMVHGLMEQTAVAGHFPGVIESRHRRKNGETFPVEVGATTFSYADETMFLTAVRDITARKQAEALLVQREREFRTLTENMPDNIARYNREGVTVYINPVLERTLGVTAAAMIGMTPREYHSDGSFEDCAQLLDSVLASGVAGELEKILLGTDGKANIHQIRMLPERGENGEVVGVLAIGRDITHIRDAGRLMSQFVTNFPGFAYSFRLSCEGHGSFPFASPGIEKLYGLKPADVKDDMGSLHALTHPDDAPRVMAAIAESARTMTAAHVEYRICRPRLPESWIEFRSIPVREADGSTLWHGVMIDITERKEAEQKRNTLARALKLVSESGLQLIHATNEQELLGNFCHLAVACGGYLMAWVGFAENDEGKSVRPVAQAGYEIGYLEGINVTWADTERGQVPIGVTIRTGEAVINHDFQNNPGLAPWREAAIRRGYRSSIALPLFSDGQVLGSFNIYSAEPRAFGNEEVELLKEFADNLSVGIGILRTRAAKERMEEQLAQRERDFRTLAENSPDIIMRYDLECRRIYVNPAFVRDLEIPTEAALGVIPDTQRWCSANMTVDEYKAWLRRAMATGETVELVVEWHRTSDGVTVHFAVLMVAEYDADGRTVGVLAIGRNISALKSAEQHLEESRFQLRGLVAKNELVREEERKHIAREVHDELGQLLTGLQLDVSLLSHKFGPDLPALREHLLGTQELVNKSLATARNVAVNLRPASLDMGIVSAIEWLLGRFGNNTGIHCEMHVHDEMRDIYLDENANIALFRIVQESLTNVARHAKASRVDVTISLQGEDCLLKVCDNGIGFDSDTIKKGSFGLVGIRERVYLLDGELLISSKPGSGTTIEVRIPLVCS